MTAAIAMAAGLTKKGKARMLTTAKNSINAKIALRAQFRSFQRPNPMNA